jgi:hypothetical protein
VVVGLLIGFAASASPAQQASYYALDSPADQHQAMQRDLSAMRDKLHVMQAELSALIAETRQLRADATHQAATPQNGDTTGTSPLQKIADKLTAQSRRIEHQLQLLDEQREQLAQQQARAADPPANRTSFTDPPIDWREQPLQIHPPDALIDRGTNRSQYYVISSPGAVAYSTHAVPRYTVGQPVTGSAVVIEHVRYPRVWHGRPHWVDDGPDHRRWPHWRGYHRHWYDHYRYHHWRYHRRSGVWFGVDGDGISIRIRGRIDHRSADDHQPHDRNHRVRSSGHQGLTIDYPTMR